MTGWIRCRTCRGLGDPEKTPFCPACGDELRADDRKHEAPEVERQAARDVRRSTGAITGLGVMGAVGLGYFFLFNLGSEWRLGALAGLILVAGGAVFFLRRRHDPKVAAAGLAVLRGLAVVGVLFMAGIALVISLLIYLFVVCATGNFQV